MPTSAAVRVTTSESKQRPVSFRVSDGFVPLLEQLGACLLVSTFESGHLAVIGQHAGQLDVSMVGFEHPMGIATTSQEIAIGTRNQIWQLQGTRELAENLAPVGKYDHCFVARRAHFTGQIDCHEIQFGQQGLWIVNTLFSCLATLDAGYHFVPRWQPPFVSALVAEDRCHLNGLAMIDGLPRFVTAHGSTDTPEGWRANKLHGGCVVAVPTGDKVVEGLAMPHSPRWHEDRLWVLHSGQGELGYVDLAAGKYCTVEKMPGYTRGLAFCGPIAFVGLSKIRESAVFGGLPIGEQADELRCGVAAVDLRTGRSVAWFQFTAGIDEVFDVQVVPNTRLAKISGPNHTDDGDAAVWLVPPVAAMSRS
jgi:uncharacterized protein (TIGR03032 family)